jgi:hypothetical protein
LKNQFTMDIVHGSQLEYKALAFTQRGGNITFKHLFRGEEGTPENYLFFLAHQGTFFSPLHRHNFDQFRYAYQGDLFLSPGILLHEGELSYHPEGVTYGPQHDRDGEREVLLLQFGGASGQGYLSFDETVQGQERLKQRGRFEGGEFYPSDGGEPQDGYEALWEDVSGRHLEYPAPRYGDIIIAKPMNYTWAPVNGESGAYRKLLGMFTECQTLAEMIKLDARRKFEVKARDSIQLFFVLKGEGEADGQAIKTESAVRLCPGAGLSLASSTGLELIHFVLPMLHSLEQNGRNGHSA